MKSYYISYKETIKLFDGDSFDEFGEKIIQAKTKKDAMKKLIETTEGNIIIDQIYETAGDAMI